MLICFKRANIDRLTITVDPAILEAGLEAERRRTSLDGMVANYVASVARIGRRFANAENLVCLLNEGAIGHIDCPVTREEIYAEQTWPRR